MPRRKPRRQRVVLRRRQRMAFMDRFWGITRIGAAVAACAALGTLLTLAGGQEWSEFIQRHTPRVEVKAPPGLTALPIMDTFPRPLIWLWVPGVAERKSQAWVKGYPALRAIHFQRNYMGKSVIVFLEARKPLVVWGDKGVDGEGVVFPLPSGKIQLPKASFPMAPGPSVGAWIQALSRSPDLWKQVRGMGPDSMGNGVLDLATGTRVNWGRMEAAGVPMKVSTLMRVLQDAHDHFNGAALADLRFFDEGRIIVRPKGR